MPEAEAGARAFDLGHRGEVDYPALHIALAMTPTERLDRHESWRVFVKEAVAHAKPVPKMTPRPARK